jgi:HEAT repeat protein
MGVCLIATISKFTITALALFLLIPPLATADDKTEEVIKLVQQLRDKDEFVRLKAAKALGKLGADAKDALPGLNDALKDDDADVRAVAKQAIATIKDALDTTKKQESLANLEKNLKASTDKDRDVRIKAVGGLAKALADTDEIIRLKAAQGLSEMGLDAKGALPDLASAAKDTDEAVRKMARRATEKINAAIDAEKAERLNATITPLIKDLTDKDAKKRLAAAEKLGGIGADAKAAREPLVEMMLDPTPAIRVGASDALEKIDAKLQKHLVTIVIGQNKAEAFAGIKEMGKEGKAAMPVLVYYYKLCQSGKGNIIPVQFLETVAAVGGDDKRVATIFNDALTAANSIQVIGIANASMAGGDTRYQACILVNATLMDPKQKTAALIIAIKDPRCAVLAINALGEIGSDAQAAIPTLKQLKQATSDAVRTAAADALGKIDK